MNKLTHVNNKGEANMVDVSDKDNTTRIAKASAKVLMKSETLQKIKDNDFKKGDVLSVARIAGIMAAKQTHHLIPMCHSLNLSKISVDFEFIENGVQITTLAKLNAQTGVEMEALTAASVAALTIYDMCKALERFIKITDIQLLEKEGGKSGHWTSDTQAALPL
ncbi:cyclic pyranopterin monophosphate synthase MoaC [thiotrophic endosymbiont of Bathymodiolus puteoserpentis (Logatchev)]|uniref:cyclic pyranopterin monophosphate synthase MoaC n=1 Tax=thiotrophic endosymbiont of Bathymodiolus puteoserpentis (Logatchev) TaxID=343240 RepID=UPI0010B9FE36|nr:cyclic pyranopterin monophosphate synthase MoaC [thiotrophic endosymbiont of Bathymodiolus puteoserpentis (Logatchev)]CAC9589721.1 Cyclic pyranopterin monophosphate synthase accessory protein [uncultured Gammaproteobacteria bacterium]CAC9599613.1 Cyclic pyranopterin monophosphate synthase (EC 4.6.1.17) [uncultured Gammaproteobacteria bacterium]CAC9653961.1 Cyclic pyranopterin monophosphate synthase (EC 4.6.1.17) [uncultured Gammaproteobacteria bacterium]CAC9969540.1 Cyclic pyranopterin monop